MNRTNKLHGPLPLCSNASIPGARTLVRFTALFGVVQSNFRRSWTRACPGGLKSALWTSLLACVTVAVLFISTPLSSANEADAKLNTFFKQYLEETFRQRPMEATQLGEHRFDRQLDDLSAAARKAWSEHARRTLAELPKQVDYQKLSRAAQIDFEILQHE